MERWTEVRRRVLTREITKRTACKAYGLHWKTLRKIPEHVEPPGYRRTHRTIPVVATVDEVRLIFEDRLIARHPRHWGRERYLFEPIHYLALLERKPGAFDYARPLAEWHLPDCFDALRRRLERTPDGLGTREFIRVLRLLEHASLPELTSAVEYAFDLDVVDADSIRVILEHRRESPVASFSLDGRPHLKLVHVPSTDVAAYGALLAPEVIVCERSTGAALDRLTHRCRIREAKGESYRLRDARRRQRHAAEA